MFVNIRLAQVADVVHIEQLQNQWTAEAITHGFVTETREEILSALGPYCFVAEAEGNLIGFIAGSLHQSGGLAVVPLGATYLEIDNLYVSPPFRSRKIGGQLVEQLMEVARQAGIRYALLYSATKDVQRVLKFYVAHGFQSWSVQMYQEL